MSEQKPSVGRIVHYQSYGTPGGEYPSVCRAAVITGTYGDGVPGGEVALAVLNPEGMFFNLHVMQDEGGEASRKGGTWHFPERV